MPRPTRLLLVVVLFLSMLPSPSIASALQVQATDELAAPDAAVELSRLEAARQYDALYDLMHPDAQAVIPRAAVTGWYTNDFGPLDPVAITVTGVSFDAWAWEVTGKTYPHTAEVSFRQPFSDGSATDDVVRLVEDESGDWRWFFGRNRAFVDEQIAKYAVQSEGSEGVFVAVVSVDASTQQRLTGACYIINAASLEGCDENGDGQVDFQGVVPGSYTVTETRAPDGYAVNTDFPISIPSGQPTTVSVRHQATNSSGAQPSDREQAFDPRLLPGVLTVASDADARCKEFAQKWLSINGTPALTVDGVRVYSGCWQDASGGWFLPTGPNDPRIPGGILDETEKAQTSVLHSHLLEQIVGLGDALQGAGLEEDVFRLYGPVKNPVRGYTAVWGTPYNQAVAEHYGPAFKQYMLIPNNLDLRKYASWWWDQRHAAYPTVALSQLDAMSQQWRHDELDPDRLPYPWDLADPVTLDLYLQWTIDQG